MTHDAQDELARLREELEATKMRLRHAEWRARHADAALNQSIIDAMPGGIVHVSREGAILTANETALRILGLSYDTLTQRYTHDFAPETVFEDGSPCSAEAYPVTQALITGRAQPPVTIGVRRPDGTTAWAIFTAVPVMAPDSTEPTGAVVTFIDITARREAENSLRESEAKLRSILDGVPNLIIVTDTAGNVLFVNRAVEEMVLGAKVWEPLDEKGRSTLQRCVHEVVHSGIASSCEVTSYNGRRHAVNVGPVRYGSQVDALTLVAWDVTRQRELEARVKLSDRMASVGTLAAGMAHEINNPLTYIIFSLERLRLLAERAERGQPPPGSNEGTTSYFDEVSGAVGNALEGAERIRAIVHDLGTFAHVDEGGLLQLDVQKMLESSLRMAQHHLRHRARVERDYQPVPLVRASDSRLGQVFLNLLVNAAQAIPEGNRDANEVRVATRPTIDGRVSIEISDTGQGMPEDLVLRAFDPFVTTKSVGEGTGLGLYICRNIVSSLGGEIEVQSAPGHGTRVMVLLPPAGDAARSTSDSAGPRIVSSRRRRILVADDEPAILRSIETILCNHDIVSVCSGRAAIQHLEKSMYDLILCDLVMSDLTGIDVHDYVQQRYPDLRSHLVFMTGGAFTERTRSFLDRVRAPVLKKPFQISELVEVVERVARAS